MAIRLTPAIDFRRRLRDRKAAVHAATAATHAATPLHWFDIFSVTTSIELKTPVVTGVKF